MWSGIGWLAELAEDRKDPGLAVSATGNMTFFKAISASKDASWLNDDAYNAYLAVYLTLMLNSKSTDIVREAAPAKLNKIRERKGQTPLYDHTVVTIVPNRYVDRGEGQGGTHATPRLHWRRTHKRHFAEKTGNAKWMATEMHKGTMGWWVTRPPQTARPSRSF